ncbi:S8 family serine peptidase [Geodermatophilus sp. DSM 44513]|uniref:S8 family serine peptidase n=1 Tax=Geodermatophilus sp. DSM 44513 TaxID=1528104 RepID=UPI0012899C29|nr:S8 family serine peptidase [Geodermatophilus sp. DSM 44513]WNV73702.1 S8 family serine peptidase [Geodermatophilus sp. DSM 44513]
MIGRPTPGARPGRDRAGALPPAATTGRSVVVFADPAEDTAAAMRRIAGLSDVADSRDVEPGDVDAGRLRDAEAVVFPGLGLAVATVDPQRLAGDAAVLAVTPELVHHVLPEVPEGYLAGYRDAVADLTGRLLGAAAAPAPTAPLYADTPQHTWGLQATEAATSPRTGRGIRVAVLDTGVDLAHPDLAGRALTATSFVPGESAQDGHGHGTHCVGTACGPRVLDGARGYGVAPETEVFVGKVLSDEGSGTDAEILAGIAWAVRNGCQVVSMSLGADTPEPSPAYTAAGRRALEQGSLIVAAAGNNADRRSGQVGFVGAPANSPDIMAVGALDAALEVAWFSARSTAVAGGQVDLAAPGVDVYSSWPLPDRYNTISGTSMATPHVAGLAALWAEQTGLRGRDLWWALDRAARRLPLPSVDVGAGLPLAPR